MNGQEKRTRCFPESLPILNSREEALSVFHVPDPRLVGIDATGSIYRSWLRTSTLDQAIQGAYASSRFRTKVLEDGQIQVEVRYDNSPGVVHTWTLDSVTFMPSTIAYEVPKDSRQVAMRSSYRWEMKNGAYERLLESSKSMSLAFGLKVSADESQPALLRPDEKLLLIRPLRPTLEPLTLVGHKSGFKAARFLDAERLISVGNEGALRVWSVKSGQELFSAALEAEGMELEVAADTGWVATATTKGTKVWDASTRKLLQHWSRDGQVWFVKSDLTGTMLATAGEPGILRIYKGEGASQNRLWPVQVTSPSIEQKTSSPIHGLAVTGDGTKVFTLNSPGCEVTCWDVANGQKQVLRRAQLGQSGRTLEISPDGNILAVGVERNIELWDLQANKQKMVLRDAESRILSLAFNHTGTRLVAGTSAGNILLWNLTSGERLLNYHAHNSFVVSLAFSFDDQRLASSSHGGELKIWKHRSFRQKSQPSEIWFRMLLGSPIVSTFSIEHLKRL